MSSGDKASEIDVILNYQTACLKMAEQELRHQQNLHHDAKVTFSLRDYKVTTYFEGHMYLMALEYVNKAPEFETWIGHPFHFAIELNTVSQAISVIEGE
jgi:hypothetical protein